MREVEKNDVVPEQKLRRRRKGIEFTDCSRKVAAPENELLRWIGGDSSDGDDTGS